MKDINFLPQRYYERDAAKFASWWRLLVVWLFGAAICSAAVYQYRLYLTLQEELAEVDSCHEVVLALQSRLQRAVDETAAEDRKATLLMYLRHPWPRTQIISSITSRLPESVAFRELRLGRATGSQGAVGGFGSTSQAENTPAIPKNASASERDLSRLRETFDRHRLLAEVEGSASDLTALHAYVAELRKCRLFDKVELVSLENEGHSGKSAAQFRLRLQLKFGYGQIGGPNVAVEPAARLPQEG